MNNYGLTKREIEILNQSSNGMRYKDIGSFNTVHNQARTILNKMEANSITHAVAKAIRENII